MRYLSQIPREKSYVAGLFVAAASNLWAVKERVSGYSGARAGSGWACATDIHASGDVGCGDLS